MHDGEHSGPTHSGGQSGVVVVLNRDLIFGSRIRDAIRALGFDVVFARDTERFVAAVRDRIPPAVLAVVDMNGAVDWASIRAAIDDPSVETPFLGFGPHVDVEGRRAAKAAGLRRILSNGEFHRDTAGLIRRYATSSEPRATSID